MAKQISVEEQNLRRKARRRLIGVFALTLAVVVILPMVLDSEPRRAEQDIELHIPSADEAGAFVPKIPVSEVVAVSPLTESPIESEVTQSAASGKTPVAVGNPATRTMGKEQVAVNQKAKPSGADKPPVVAEGFIAQVGAYSNADTAKRETEKLKKLGFKVYTEKVAGMVRVRVGPYADREKAEQTSLKLEKHGFHPVVMSAKGS